MTSPSSTADLGGSSILPLSTAPLADPVIADPSFESVARSAAFHSLVKERTRFGWILTFLMLIVYFGFIGLIAFDKPLLATKIGQTASLGLFLGVGVIAFAFILTGIYVFRANTRYDALIAILKGSIES